MENCNPKLLPCDINAPKVDQIPESEPLTDKQKYQEIVGGVIYLSCGTRPDLIYAMLLTNCHNVCHHLQMLI